MSKQNLKSFLIVLFMVLLIGYFFKPAKTEVKESNELIIYKGEDELPHDPYSYCCATNEIYTKVKTETPNAKVLNVSEKGNYILIEDGSLKILNTNSNELKTINLETGYYRYYLQTIDNENLVGITYYKAEDYMNGNHAGYFDLQTNTKLYEDEYSVITAENEYYLIALDKDGNSYLLSSHEEKIIPISLDTLDNNEDVKTEILLHNDKIMIAKYLKEKNTYNLYDTNDNLITEDLSLISQKEEKIYTLKDENLTIYDFENNILSKDKLVYNIEFLVKDYGFYILDDSLYLLDLNTLVPLKLLDLENTYTLANTYQGYKETGFSKENKNKEGIYIYLTKLENKQENRLDTIDIEILITNSLTITVTEIDGTRMQEQENGGIISE